MAGAMGQFRKVESGRVEYVQNGHRPVSSAHQQGIDPGACNPFDGPAV